METEKQPSNAKPLDGARSNNLSINEVLHVARMMRRDGDGFFSDIGHAILRGTEGDIKKIKEMWPDKWEHFKRMRA